MLQMYYQFSFPVEKSRRKILPNLFLEILWKKFGNCMNKEKEKVKDKEEELETKLPENQKKLLEVQTKFSETQKVWKTEESAARAKRWPW